MDRYRRKNYLPDRQWQLSVIRNIAGAALMAGLAYLLTIYLIPTTGILGKFDSRQIGMVAVAVNALYFLALLAAVVLVTIRVTQSVAGPAMVLERAIEGMCEGNFAERLSLRDGDYLKDLAASLEKLSKQLQQQDSERNRTGHELIQALATGELERARNLAKGMFGKNAKKKDEAKDLPEPKAPLPARVEEASKETT